MRDYISMPSLMRHLLMVAGLVLSFAAAAQPTALSSTLLPNGRYLVSGGKLEQTVVSQLSLYDATTQQTTTLKAKLATPRTGHSATVLPDGMILILGGVGQDGYPVVSAEIIDLAAQKIQVIAAPGLLARSQHRATLLTDGKVLITGGLSANGQAIGAAELWNPKTQQPESLRANLLSARYSHIAELLATAPVLIQGGKDATGKSLTSKELYDIEAQRFATGEGASSPDIALLPAVAEIIPPDNSFNIALDSHIVIRFNKPLKVDTLNSATVNLLGPIGMVPVKVVAAEGGMLLFVTPGKVLTPDTQYTLFVKGATDILGQALPFTASSLKTVSLAVPSEGQISLGASAEGSSRTAITGTQDNPRSSATKTQAQAHEPEEDDDWIPGPQNYKGEWKSHKASLSKNYPAKRTELTRAYLRHELERDGRLKPTKLEAKLPQVTQAAVAPGITAIAGQVLKINGRPLPGVTLSMGNQAAVSNTNGEFMLTNVPSGTQVLVIDGTTANTAKRKYGRYYHRFDVQSGVLNALPQPVWLVKLDTQHAIKIPSPTTQEVLITNPKLPGLEIRLPAGVVIRDHEGKPVTEVSLTPVPADQTPFAMPYGEIPVYYTLQPGGAVIQSVTGKPQGATVTYPNYSTQPHGAKFEFFDYDPHGRGWYIYTTGTVSADGKRIVGDKPFQLYQFTASSAASSGGTAPTKAPGNCNGIECTCPQGSTAGDPVSCHDGLFMERNTDLALRDVMPLALTRTYRNEDANQRTFGVGASHQYDLYLYFPNYSSTITEFDLVLPSGGRIPFNVVGTNTTYTNPAALYESLVPGEFYKAKLQSSPNGWLDGFIITLKNGTRYAFSYYQSRLKWIEDRNGNRTAITRDINNRISRVTSPNGRYIDFEYLTASCTTCITKATDHTGRFVSYDYDIAGRLWKVTNPESGLTEYSYDTTTHRMLSVKDPRYSAGEVPQPKVTNEYYTSADGANLDGRVKKQTYADLSTNSFTYAFDTSGKITQTEVTRERGDVRRIEYNAEGFITRETLALGLPEQQVTTNVWDSTTKLLTSTTDALNRITAYEYDAKGNVKKLTRMQATVEQAAWNFTYEPIYNQVETATDPLNRTTQFTYDNVGNLAEIKNLGNNTRATMTYTALGQLKTQTAYVGAKALTTTYEYDYGDLYTVTDPLQRTTSYFNDSLGRVAAVTDPLSNISFIDYDKLDRVRFQVNALNHMTEYQYDANGNLKLLKDANLHATSYTYDARNRVKTMTDPLLKTESYDYDQAGNLIRITDRKSQVTGMSYDALDRLKQTGYGATPAAPTSYTRTVDNFYDAGNRAYQIVDSQNGTLTRDFDGQDRLKQETGPTGTINYTYYANGLRETQTVLGQATVNYRYDNGNRLYQIDQSANVVSFGFDEANRRTSLTLLNGVTLTYTLDDASQVTRIDYAKGPLVIGDLTYAYDDAGRRIQMGGSLAKANLPQAMTAQYDNANQLTQFNARTLNYDDNGNLANDGLRGYTWNAANQLTNISGVANAVLQYDPLGRRQSKTVNGIQTGYLHDGINPVRELNADNSTKADLLTGGVDQFFSRTSNGTTSSFITDALGSTLALTDSAGAITTQYSYEAYGNTTASGTPSDNSFQFTGRENDGTGLMYYRARYYSPELSRFISQDPIGFNGGINFYAYVEGDPISGIDPLGLFCLSNGQMGAISGALGGAVSGGLGMASMGLPAALAGAFVGATVGGYVGWATAANPSASVGWNVGMATASGGVSSPNAPVAGAMGAAVGWAAASSMASSGVSPNVSGVAGAAVGGAAGGFVAGWLPGTAARAAAAGGAAGAAGAWVSTVSLLWMQFMNNCSCGTK